MKNFKPQLLPNDEAGVAIDWEQRLNPVTDWLISSKLDGARVELPPQGAVLGRSLKVIPNIHIQKMGVDLQNNLKHSHIIEAEFYSPNMNFSEIMHFFKTEDVESEKTYDKYYKLWSKSNFGSPALGWPFPGRNLKWVTTWQLCLKFYAFDYVISAPKVQRILILNDMVKQSPTIPLVVIPQRIYPHIDAIYQAYDQAIISGGEGLVAMHKNSRYKTGRYTEKEAQGFKIKDSNKVFEGVVLDVEEATEAREGAEKTTNELGRSVTSKLKEDRIPSGLAKGFLVLMDDGNQLTVSLKGFNHDDRRKLLLDPSEYLGKYIQFTGMEPVKPGGCPRHAHYTYGTNI
jgi:hypothetical protein